MALQLGDFFDLDIRLWTFGEISTKDDINIEEFNDDKVTSEHSFTFNLFGLGFGKGMEHKLGYQGGHDPFTQSDFRWLSTRFGATTKTDVLGNVVEKEHNSTVFGISPILFSIELTKDFK